MKSPVIGVWIGAVLVALCGLAAWLNRERIVDALQGKENSAHYI